MSSIKELFWLWNIWGISEKKFLQLFCIKQVFYKKSKLNNSSYSLNGLLYNYNKQNVEILNPNKYEVNEWEMKVIKDGYM